MKKLVYIIHPVRHVSDEQRKVIDAYVNQLEIEGYTVHYPIRDVNQNDGTGYCIISTHAEAMLNADEVHVFFDPNSEGSKFDLGMAFICKKADNNKKIILVNKIEPTREKSFNNFMLIFADIKLRRDFPLKSMEPIT